MKCIFEVALHRNCHISQKPFRVKGFKTSTATDDSNRISWRKGNDNNKTDVFCFIRMNVAAPGIKDTKIGRGIKVRFGGVPNTEFMPVVVVCYVCRNSSCLLFCTGC